MMKKKQGNKRHYYGHWYVSDEKSPLDKKNRTIRIFNPSEQYRNICYVTANHALNAKLIAVAPDMLDVIRDIYDRGILNAVVCEGHDTINCGKTYTCFSCKAKHTIVHVLKRLGELE